MTIDEAKVKAMQLNRAAYGVQPVRQADGTVLELCLPGRLHRAYRMASDAVAAGDTAKVATLQAGIDTLAAIAREAWRAADAAVIDYSAMAVAAGREPESLELPDCQCAGCREAGRLHRVGSAMGKVREIIWEFMGDDGEGAPALLLLARKGDDGALRSRLSGIVTAMQEYMDVCRQYDVRPNWRELWA